MPHFLLFSSTCPCYCLIKACSQQYIVIKLFLYCVSLKHIAFQSSTSQSQGCGLMKMYATLKQCYNILEMQASQGNTRGHDSRLADADVGPGHIPILWERQIYIFSTCQRSSAWCPPDVLNYNSQLLSSDPITPSKLTGAMLPDVDENHIPSCLEDTRMKRGRTAFPLIYLPILVLRSLQLWFSSLTPLCPIYTCSICS